MKKQIYMKISNRRAARDFGRLPNSSAVGCPPFEVDLDLLSPAARTIAERIFTTWNGDDASNLFVESDKTNGELNPGELPPDHPRSYKSVMPDWFSRKARICWKFDQMRDDETPERYFERQAKRISEIGGHVV